jgi:nesprin-1
LNKNVSAIQRALQRWSEFDLNTTKMSEWIKEKLNEIKQLPDSKGEIGEMKTQQERLTSICNDVLKEQTNLERLDTEATFLAKVSSDQKGLQAMKNLREKLLNLEAECQKHKEHLQKEIDSFHPIG